MSIATLATGNDDIMEWFFKWDGSKYTIIKIIIPVCLYILISLLFPEKKIVTAEIDDIQGRKSFNYYIIYGVLTIILAVSAVFIRR